MNRRLVISLAVAALSCGVSRSAAAQRVTDTRVGIQQIPTLTSVRHVKLGLTVEQTYWKEGALIGAIPGAIVGYVGIKGLGGNTLEALSASVGAAAVAGIIGALIGGQFPKGGS